MTQRQVRCFDYVNKPFARVSEILRSGALGVFQRATTTAAARAQTIATTLKVSLGQFQLATEVHVTVLGIHEVSAPPPTGSTLRIQLTWHATQHPGLFPTMEGELSVYGLSATETQLDFQGHYAVPMGAVGATFDAVVGHRLAEASVHRFVQEVAAQLRAELSKS